MPSARTNIRTALMAGLRSMSIAGGYNQSYQVLERETSPENMREFPTIDVIWTREEIQNQPQNSADYNIQVKKKGFINLDVWLHDVNDIDLARENALRDVERFLGLNYGLPDSNGNATVIECWLLWNEVFGWKADKPNGGITIGIGVHYRQGMTNPDVYIG